MNEEKQRPGHRPLLGISTCLLGEPVRYNGGHKHDYYLTDILGAYVDYQPVCPEVECGMGIPREAVHLEGTADDNRLVGTRSKTDWTNIMNNWAEKRLDELSRQPLCGFIFKSGSPSSGMTHVKVYDKNGVPHNVGVGMFARAVIKRFPFLPVEDDGRLHSAAIKETFLDHVFTLHRFYDLQKKPTAEGLVEFHSQHKMIYLSHSPQLQKELGQIVAAQNKNNLDETLKTYHEVMTRCLKTQVTIQKHTNVLMHLMGFFKEYLSDKDRHELLGLINDYHKELIPLIVPITLINHHTRHLDNEYLSKQLYLHPHPHELKLRNHL